VWWLSPDAIVAQVTTAAGSCSKACPPIWWREVDADRRAPVGICGPAVARWVLTSLGWQAQLIEGALKMRTKRPLREPVREAPGPKLKNYITPAGLQRLKDEHRFLLHRERPAVTRVVAWAAGNGDRSENADYLYAKRRLRQIDSRIRFLTKRIDAAEVVDPEAPRQGSAATRVFFGATVRYEEATGVEREVRIVGVDEVDLDRQYISWMSPLARALMKAAPGDTVILRAPTKTEELEILEVRYARIPVQPFREPAGAEAGSSGRFGQ
jgi:transcription elongation factor GreB